MPHGILHGKRQEAEVHSIVIVQCVKYSLSTLMTLDALDPRKLASQFLAVRVLRGSQNLEGWFVVDVGTYVKVVKD